MHDDVKRFLIACSDLILIVFSYYAAFAIRFEMVVPFPWLTFMSDMLLVVIPVRFCIFWHFGLYRPSERFGTADDLVSIVKAVLISSLAVVPAVYAMTHLAGYRGYPPRSIFVLDPLVLIIMIGGARFSMRLIREIRSARKGMKRVLIVGAGEAAESILREIIKNGELNYRPVGLVDDDRQKIGSTLHGVKVLGPSESIKQLVEQHRAGEVMIAIPSATGAEMRRIVGFCKECGVPYKTLPGVSQIIDGKARIDSLRDVHYSDLLRRDPILLDTESIKSSVSGRTILVTGAGGSIGSELCRQLVGFDPGKLILIDACEENLFNIQMKLHQEMGYEAYKTVLGRVQNRRLMERVFHAFQPSAVFHAAAYKHVPLMEVNPWEAVFNNILASRVAMEVANECGVERFVLVSTDKAVRPSSVMGVSKRISELLLQCFPSCGTRFVAVRFGNVIGSSGSVIPLFKHQIERGGPVTVTHPEVSRYFMLIPEAAQLILQTASIGLGGEIFILKMGKPVKIAEIAEDLIRLSGKEPGRDIEIVFTGLRDGEKLHEQLVGVDEDVTDIVDNEVSVVKCGKKTPRGFASTDAFRRWLDGELKDLYQLAAKMDSRGIREKLHEIVPEYTPQDEAVKLFKEIVPEYTPRDEALKLFKTGT
jgi:FlaA1/EpsC-like NDP-sugar epimerase